MAITVAALGVCGSVVIAREIRPRLRPPARALWWAGRYRSDAGGWSGAFGLAPAAGGRGQPIAAVGPAVAAATRGARWLGATTQGAVCAVCRGGASFDRQDGSAERVYGRREPG